MCSAAVVKWPGGRALWAILSWCLGALVVGPGLLLLSCGPKLSKLREQLNDPDPDVRITAIKALAEARDNVSVARIADLLQDTVPDVRREAARGLGRIGDERACQPLADFYGREQLEGVQDAGIRALTHLGRYSVRPLIGLLLSPRPVVRAGAARALGRVQARDAVDPLIGLLRDRAPEVKQAAIFALRQIGDERGLDAVASLVEDNDEDVERAAERALSGEGYQEQLNRAKRKVRRLPYP